MAALTQPRMPRERKGKNMALQMVGGAKAWQGGAACIDTAANVVRPMVSANANLIRIGEFAESVDNSAQTAGGTTLPVLISFDTEFVMRWYDNATGANAVTAGNVYQNVYMLDDHTVQVTTTGNSVAGRCFQLDPVNGVLIVRSSF